MGQDKGSMTIQGSPMILHLLSRLNNEIDEVVIVLNDEKRISKYRKIIDKNQFTYKIKFVEDIIKNKGPLSGIMTGLKNINSDYALVLPCDSPRVSKNLVNYLFSQIEEEYQGIVPYHSEDNKIKTSEPLHSIYKKTNIELMKKQLDKNVLNIKGLIEKINCKFIAIDNENLIKKDFENLNTPNDVIK